MAKTRQDALLQLFPTAPVDGANVLELSLCDIDSYYKQRYEDKLCPKGVNGFTYDCNSCRECFWRTEVDV